MLNWIKQFFDFSMKATHPAETLSPSNVSALSAAQLCESISQKEQGDKHLGTGNFAAAAECYRHAIAINPDYAKAHSNLGFIFKEQGLHSKAEISLSRAIAIDPTIADAHYMLGALSQADGKIDIACMHLRKTLELAPDFEIAYRDLCYLLYQRGQLADAQQVIIKGISLNPGYADLYYYLGNLYYEEQQFDLAINSFQKALSIQPEHAEVLANLGLALLKNDNFDHAIAALQKAVILNPDLTDAYNSLGNALHNKNKFEAAIACYEKGISLNPKLDYLHYNLGLSFHAQNKLVDATVHYHNALSINPDYSDARATLGLAALLMGDFESGWRNFEYRVNQATEIQRSDFVRPLWLNDTDIKGKSILLYAEQGMGDTLQFVRYVEQVIALGAAVYIEVQPPLKSLLTCLPDVTAVLAKGEPLPTFDYRCPLASLPLAFKTDLASIPSRVPYLTVSSDKISDWAAQLQSHTMPRIGIAWAGNAQFKNDRNRSVHLHTLLPILTNENYHFFSLQKDILPPDRLALQNLPTITDLGPKLSSFLETAAIIANLDLVITVDTSVAHLAGALGKPVWILLAFSPDFRWLLDRTDSPWYPSARLFRQPAIGDWDSVIDEIRRSLIVKFG